MSVKYIVIEHVREVQNVFKQKYSLNIGGFAYKFPLN